MKRLLTNFDPIFDPTAKTLDFTALSYFNISKLYAVINVTRNVAIYIPGAPNLGVSNINSSIITLQYDTSTHSTSDQLNIFYDDDNIDQKTNISLNSSIDETLKKILVEQRITNIILHEIGFNKIFSLSESEIETIRNDLLERDLSNFTP
jgi:hypothetical protein